MKKKIEFDKFDSKLGDVIQATPPTSPTKVLVEEDYLLDLQELAYNFGSAMEEDIRPEAGDEGHSDVELSCMQALCKVLF